MGQEMHRDWNYIRMWELPAEKNHRRNEIELIPRAARLETQMSMACLGALSGFVLFFKTEYQYVIRGSQEPMGIYCLCLPNARIKA